MSDIVITVENLCKKYTIGHQKQARYETFRESLNHMGRGLMERVRHPLSPNKENFDLEEFHALKDVNFEIKQGDRVGIIGRNGAGKSTLLKILSRITEPTSGRVTIKGRVASLLEVGTGFHPELTGRENIFLNGAILGMSRVEIKKKFDEIVDFSEIEKFLDTPVKRYSSGMYVRLAFAVAAHLEPEILLIDEVLAVGDAEFQKKCLGKMEDVSKEGRTILFVSHNIPSISALCTTGLLLERGKIKERGRIANIIDRYMTRTINSLNFEKVSERKGNGVIRFNSVKIFSDISNKNSVILTGKPFFLELKLLCQKKIVSNNVIIDLRIDNLLGNRLIWLSTSIFNEWTINDNTVTFFIEALPLNEGVYSVTLYCKIQDTVSDWLQNAFTFNVKNLNTNSSGKIVNPSQASFITNYKIL
jgi:homopolymeric O-antigen transport system ATP-binding protein